MNLREALLIFALQSLDFCAAHYGMIVPPSWQDPNGAYAMQDDWRAAGCTGETPPPGEENVTGCISQWYTNHTFIPGNATIPDDSELITYQFLCRSKPGTGNRSACEGMKRNPWRAPGTAKVWGPCGVDGGNPQGCPVGNPNASNCDQGGYGHGPDGRTLRGNDHPAEWSAGSVVEVAFGVTANHGGGYQYRLCRMPSAGRTMLTEKCFQETPLSFIGDTQWLQWGNNASNRTAIPAVRTAVGTFPLGSQWTRNPIPACGTTEGGGITELFGKCMGSQFEPPLPGVYGFYGQTPNTKIHNPNGRHALTHWSVVDKVQLPHELSEGDYVISFRIDCEQTPQIWQYCSDVRISKAKAGANGAI